MTLVRFRRSLQAKLLIAVVVCGLVPLALVGLWLSTSAVRSGRMLLRTQLDSAAARSAGVVRQRWAIRRSDVLLLATSGPVRVSLGTPSADTAPAYARRAFATMSGLASVVARDSSGRARWMLGEGVRPYLIDPRTTGREPSGPPATVLRSPVTDSLGRTIGEIEAQVRLDALAPVLPIVDIAPSQFIAYRDRGTEARLGPVGVPSTAFTDEYFDWNDHRWLAVRHRLDDPPIDVVAAATVEPFLAPFASTAQAGAAALAFAAGIVLVLTVLVTRRLTGSLVQLAVAADRVSQGALDTRVDSASEDEVGRVGRAFNAMLDNLARMMRELSVRESVAAMGELAATIAHQVRSPATAIRLDVQRAHDKLQGGPERALLARALEQLDRMERAVSGSLAMARAVGTDFIALDVREPLRRALAGVRREGGRRARTVDSTAVPTTPVYVSGDAASLEQLFSNVLTNAAQATSDGGSVAVTLEADAGPQLVIRIHDDGPGMSPDVLARAGEPLFSTKPQGTGLGLAIARRIALAHGGSIALESVEGSGTTVVIQLPRASGQSC